MTKKDSSRQKQNFICSALMLCLVHQWTIGGNPTQELRNLAIPFGLALKTILELIKQGFLKSEVRNFGRKILMTQILLYPSEFREARVLTEKGERMIKLLNYSLLRKSWQQYQKEAQDNESTA